MRRNKWGIYYPRSNKLIARFPSPNEAYEYKRRAEVISPAMRFTRVEPLKNAVGWKGESKRHSVAAKKGRLRRSAHALAVDRGLRARRPKDFHEYAMNPNRFDRKGSRI